MHLLCQYRTMQCSVELIFRQSFAIKNNSKRGVFVKKRIIIIILTVIFLFLLIPFPQHMNDGGTVVYKAVLYSVTNYKRIKEPGVYDTGIEIKLLGMTVYENTTFGK